MLPAADCDDVDAIASATLLRRWPAADVDAIRFKSTTGHNQKHAGHGRPTV